MERLPIDEILGAIAAGVESGPNVLVEAPPGAGKTTRVPARPRVARLERLPYLGLVPHEQRGESPPAPEATRLLRAAALAAGFDPRTPEGAVVRWLGRVRSVRERCPTVARHKSLVISAAS
jgi:hypothetical protein